MKQENQNKVQDLQNGNTESGKQKTFRRTAKRQTGAAKTSAAKNTTESGTARSGVRTAKKAGGDGTSMNASYLPVYDNAKRAPKTLKNAPKAEESALNQAQLKTGKTFIADARFVREKANERAMERAYEKMYGAQGEAVTEKNLRGGRNKKPVKIIFLGGVGEIGKNMTAIEYGNDIIVVDAGLTFPNNEDMPGIDLVVPDITYQVGS